MRITDLPNLTTGSFNDYLYIIDVSDTGSFLSGSSKKIKLGNLFLSPVTSSKSISSSYALTASYAMNGGGGGGGGTTLYTGSTYPITSSWAIKAITASYALNGSGGSTTLHTGSKYPITSSWAIKAISTVTASYAFNYGNSITQSFTNSSVWNFNHYLGQKQVLIQAYNINDDQIVPTSITLLDASSARLTFPVNISGYAVATRGGIRILSSSYGYYNLNTGSSYPITSSWSINSLTASVATRLLNSDSVSQSFNNLSTWVFNHNLNDKPVLVQAYNNLFNQVIPANIILNDDNTATLSFPFSASGYAIATRSGLRTVTNTGNYATTGSNNFKNTQTISNGFLILSQVSSSLNYANDVAAAAGGVPLGGIYRNGNIIQIRLT